MKNATLTFATSKHNAMQRLKEGAYVEKLDENRYAVTIPVEIQSKDEIPSVVDGLDEDVDTFTARDQHGNVWTEEDFE
jgi:hypothetical protein